MTWTSNPYMRAGIELDRIAVEGIRVSGNHGVFESERETGQLFLADVVAHVSTREAAAHDDLSQTVNYSDIADKVAAVLGGDPSSLIEAVAERAASAVLKMEGVFCVDIRIHKPQAPLHVEFKDVTVTIRREHGHEVPDAAKRIGSSAGMSDDPLDLEVQAPMRDHFDQRPASVVPVLIALGGNVGPVEATLRTAVDALSKITGVEVISTSPLVSSAAVGGPPQPDYLNAVVRIHTILSPRELLGACQGIEMVHGRERHEINGPRTLDIDIIDYGGGEGSAPDITLPHPRARDRAFVLVPWVLMEPHGVLPGLGPIAPAAAAVSASVAVVIDPWPAPATS